MHDKQVGGVRLGVISNAGFETVGMADAIKVQRYAVEIATLSDDSTTQLKEVLDANGLSRLVNARIPLDITPMASEEVYQGAIRSLGRYLCHRVDRVCSGSRVAEAVAVS